MRYTKLLIALFVMALYSCDEKQNEKEIIDPISGWWKAELTIDSSGLSLPFFLNISKNDNRWFAEVINGDERILHKDVSLVNDTLRIQSPVFNSEIIAVIDQNNMTGSFRDYSRGNDYSIPFSAKYNLTHRFSFENELSKGVDGRWLTVFGPNSENPDTAIGLFEQIEGNRLLGTFLTTTGDYRFLEGGFDGKTMKLSSFDGSHAFYFGATYNNDTLTGVFHSGNHWKEDFIAWRDSSVELEDPYTLTAIKDGKTPLNLELPEITGKNFDLDSSCHDQPVIIQIMGTWCPNCMDETIFLSRNQAKIKDLGVHIVAVTFERRSMEESVEHLNRFKENLGIQYPILFGGKASKLSAAAVFPQIEHVLSFPTTLFLDKEHKITRVHTGYYGPGTGRYFDAQNNQFWRSIHKILPKAQ